VGVGFSDSAADAGNRPKLAPEMASRRLLVLAFVRDYIDRWGASPSHGEIAAGLGISRTRSRQLVKALVKSGQLLSRPGPRGLSMPTLRDEAVRQLRELGWTVDADVGEMRAPCANSTLPAPILLDYLPSGSDGGVGNGEESRDGGARDSAAA
jgi:hypothetical protein